MTRLRLQFIHRFRDRHGLVRHYFRRAGHPRLALPGLPGSPEFMAAYQAALAQLPPPVAATRSAPGSMDALIVAWYGSAGFKALSPQSVRTYRNTLERFRAQHGQRLVADLEARHVRGLLDAQGAKPAAANKLLQLLRQLMQFAVERNMRADNPVREVRKLKLKVTGWRAWSDEEIAQYQGRHPIGTRPHLALSLLLHTGQRRGDVVRMGPQHLRAGRIHVVQGKTGEALAIPVHDELREALEACRSNHLAFLATEFGKPFTAAGFGNWFADRVREAGLPKGCSAHGLRKAAGRRLAEAGCSAHEIKSITGHRTLGEVERYTRSADQARLADAAMTRIGGRKPAGP